MAINKMFIMVPVMLAARKLDGDNATTVHWLRVSYATVQSLCLLVVFYTYYKAYQASKAYPNVTIYVPPAPLPFADPNAKKKYLETQFSVQVLSVARTLLGSMLFGLAMTIGLHYYKNVVMGLAIQSVMGPLNLIENPLVIALLWRGGQIRPEDKIFDEKKREELTPDDEVEDERGNIVNRSATSATTTTATGANGTTSTITSASTLEEILLDAWDAGTSADLGVLMNAINSMNVNDKTQESGWTPLMILSGLGVPGTASAIRQVRDGLGGDPTIVDAEGWNALHWAAFHGSLEGAKALLKSSSTSTVTALLNATDKEGKTPLDHAKQEGNLAVVKVLETQLTLEASAPADETAATTPRSDNTRGAEDGLRKRK